jgi:hypothetical protein
LKTKPYLNQDGSALICALCTILIISLIGANVLLNCTTRYNVSSKQVKGWKEAMYAAEGGGDIAFSILHSSVPKVMSDLATTFPSSQGWQTSGSSYSNGPYTFGQNNSLSAKVTVDVLTATLSGQQKYYFRIRSQGTATLFGLPRVGMDDRMDNVTKGDSLLRKIDFKYDHFKATYGDGDGNGKAIQTVSYPQITRRIETIAVPQFLTSFTGAVQATGSFDGPGSAGSIDSYDSKNGAYTFVANNSSSPYYNDSQNGDVAVGTSVFTEYGPIYGNVTTNGGNITHKSNGTISGTIDNNVAFTVPPVAAPNTVGFSSGASVLSPPTPTQANNFVGTTSSNPVQYVYNSSLSSNLTINGQTVASGPNAGKSIETYVRIVVNGNITKPITVAKGVTAQIYFTGNLSLKASDVVNNNVDGANGVVNYVDGTTWTNSTDYSRAGHLQLYGTGSTQTVDISSPGALYATIYAPNADVTINGNADIYGAIVCHNYSGNGNTSFHYDKEAAQLFLSVTDYRIASYIEDVR